MHASSRGCRAVCMQLHQSGDTGSVARATLFGSPPLLLTCTPLPSSTSGARSNTERVPCPETGAIARRSPSEHGDRIRDLSARLNWTRPVCLASVFWRVRMDCDVVGTTAGSLYTSDSSCPLVPNVVLCASHAAPPKPGALPATAKLPRTRITPVQPH